MPAIVAAASPRASRRYLEFFAVAIENPNTRAAYFHACRRFFAWCEHKGLDELVAIEPMHVAAYIRNLSKDFEKPTVKQHLAAIRMLFDWLVVGQVVAINPAHSVRGPKHAIKRGKTSVDRETSVVTLTNLSLSERANALFDAAHRWHGAIWNTSSVTRVSIDIRLVAAPETELPEKLRKYTNY